jgi:hypothetical protein
MGALDDSRVLRAEMRLDADMGLLLTATHRYDGKVVAAHPFDPENPDEAATKVARALLMEGV